MKIKITDTSSNNKVSVSTSTNVVDPNSSIGKISVKTGPTGPVGAQGTIGPQGTIGSQGLSGTTGVQGATGQEGSAGAQGVQGVVGLTGGEYYNYQFSTDTGDTDPGAGYLKFNNADISLASLLHLSSVDATTSNLYNFIQYVDDSSSAIKGTIKVYNTANTLQTLLYSITDQVEYSSDYFTIYVDNIGSTVSTFEQDATIAISFARTGDVGQTGQTGDVGPQGTQGTIGAQGLSGSQGVQGVFGSQGIQGSIGLQGVQGSIGSQGIQGLLGTQGSIGSQGVQGTQGLTGALNRWAVKTSNYTAVDGDRLIADTTGGTFTITLPATPSAGDYVQISDGGNWNVTNLTVARNGSTIDGYADDLLLNLSGVTVEFIYDGSTWEVTATTGARGAQGTSGALSRWQVITANYTASDGQRLLADTSGGTFTILLPSSPNVGDYVVISDGADWSVNNLIIGRNGSTIEGVSDDTILDLKNITVEFIYDGSTWEITATTGAKGAQGTQGTLGLQGDQGDQGVQGVIGSQGIQGVQGGQGVQGPKGDNSLTFIKTATTTTVVSPSNDVFIHVSPNVVSVTSNYSITNAVSVILANGNLTLTLPSADLIPIAEYHIKNIGNGNVTTQTVSSQTIDGQLNITSSERNTAFTVKSDGSNWFIF
jgi:Collagen triple helix repeat (20 copies)